MRLFTLSRYKKEMKCLSDIVVECTHRLSQVLPGMFLPCRVLESEVIWPAPEDNLKDFVRIYERVVTCASWKADGSKMGSHSNLAHCTTNLSYLPQDGNMTDKCGMGEPESHHPMRNGGVSAPESHAHGWKEMACVPPRNGKIAHIPVPGVGQIKIGMRRIQGPPLEEKSLT